ncbi:Selenocysteine-containing peroxiredoxin PrxU [Fundidesulfovibrio magnetotacticus]|uniref:Peroxiredoxin n=1 Tax=Fundidesulfovibrio magnetotacticus TaxID=2730080 RepID=A0A6V8M1G6_9BACT|nr:peroxiredoxin [Fundidesulfovibrio magnetotacticus]GFK96059.1 Selenocysteine-containing peroxiredoxin PrxU [Fundidesulfovibrio magnetotacticus]
MDHAPCPPGLPRIGDPAPGFEAESTQGVIRLEDYKGSWLVFFSHPADFTPVCTTEFMAFAGVHERLRALDCELLGLSIDSVFSHIAWVRRIEETFGVRVEFPVVADLSMDVARLYGMIMPGESRTETSRCVFVIDPAQKVRAVVWYPLTTGRNTEEIVRLVEALRATDAHGVATPANWRPGDKVIVPAPRTQDGADERAHETGTECKDWFFCTRSL